MPKTLFALFVFFAAALIFPDQSLALVKNRQTDKVSAEIITAADTFNPQEGLDILVKLHMRDGWHIYWNNPGDTGTATAVSWRLPEGYKVEQSGQSIPKKFIIEGIVQYGYDDIAYLKYRLKTDGKTEQLQDKLRLRATVSWLACKDECADEAVDIDLELPVSNSHSVPLQSWQDEAVKATGGFPKEDIWHASYDVKSNHLLINVDVADADFVHEARNIVFIPDQPDIIVNNAPQSVGFDNKGKLSVSVPLENTEINALSGLIVAEKNGGYEAYRLEADRNSGLAEYAPIHFERESLALIMLMAFFGGIILNFMPCIFPILSVKAIALAQNVRNRSTAKTEALIYASGVVISFLLTATVLIWLRRQGENIGWGFQLQSPVFVLVMIVIFFIIFLMLLDVINFRGPFAGQIGRISFSRQKINAFFTGFFAVLIASPCTAPFMGIAIGYTLSKPVYVYYPVFLALSLGYALPFTLIGMFPEMLARLLPKPGRWMEVLKKIFAIPVLMTCFWLMWVFWHLTADVRSTEEALIWHPYDAQEVRRLVDKGESVFIDFSAKWCITCLANEKIALDTERFALLARERRINLFKADWTSKDKHIAEALAHFGRNSIPLYVYYENGGSPVILPQLLTPGIVEEYLDER